MPHSQAVRIHHVYVDKRRARSVAVVCIGVCFILGLIIMAFVGPNSGPIAPSAWALPARGVCYAPNPAEAQGELVPNDDFMAFYSQIQKSRDDVALLHTMGANAVRTYGLDPSRKHRAFFDALNDHGMRAFIGLSDYGYFVSDGGCATAVRDFDCYEEQYKNWRAMLVTGGLLVGGAYHPGVQMVALANELELKLKVRGVRDRASFYKAALSTLDGIISAEADINPDLSHGAPSFTLTNSFSVCEDCASAADVKEVPAVAFMLDVQRMARSGNEKGIYQATGYRPKNDLAVFLKGPRFVHSFNTQNRMNDPIVAQTFAKYAELPEFKMPHGRTKNIFIAEMHDIQHPDPSRAEALGADIAQALAWAQDDSHPLSGVYVFEFTQAQWKGGSEVEFGIAKFGPAVLGTLQLCGVECKDYNLQCIADVAGMSHAVAAAYGGKFEGSALCAESSHSIVI